jgi:nucleotide-binding universal stress UspA family protein
MSQAPVQCREQNQSLSFRHIVSAIDLTVASAVATRTVLDLVRRTGARVTLVHALKASHPTVLSGGAAVRVVRNLQAQAAQVTERFRRKIPPDVRLGVDARVTTGDPHRAILRIASDVKADLTVMGVPPRSRFDEVLFGSTLRNVLRRAQIPVLVLPVLAGAHKWLEDTDGVDVRPRPLARAKGLRARS